MSRRKGGLFLPLDVNFWDDPRIVRAGERAAVLYLSMALACRRMGCGELTVQQIARLNVTGWRARLVVLGQHRLVDQTADDIYRLRRINPPPARPYIAPALREQVHDRDDWRCVECGSRERLEVDHVVPYSHGGPDTLDNLRTLCKSCNCRRGARV